MRHGLVRVGGVSLVELVAAMGLLAGILFAVAGLLVQARSQIAGGRNSSLALALGRNVVEEITDWSFARIPAMLDCEDRAAACSVDLSGTSIDFWAARPQDVLPGARVDVLLEPLDALALSDALAIRVTVAVHWNQGHRRRHVRLVAVRS